MTEDTHAEIVRSAIAEGDDPALLSGNRAKVAMLGFALFLAVGPLLFFIPYFDEWREVVAYIVALGMAACSPLIAALIPRKLQEQYRQALIESEQRRRQMHTEVVSMREFARGIERGTNEVKAAAVAAAVAAAKAEQG
jgi:hypothetical protein